MTTAAARADALRSRVLAILDDPISDDRLAGSLLRELLDRSRATVAELAQASQTDPQRLQALIAQAYRPGELFGLDVGGEVRAADALAVGKLRRQIALTHKLLGVSPAGTISPAFHGAALAIRLAQAGVTDILDIEPRYDAPTIPAGSPVRREYQDVGDGGQTWTGRFLAGYSPVTLNGDPVWKWSIIPPDAVQSVPAGDAEQLVTSRAVTGATQNLAAYRNAKTGRDLDLLTLADGVIWIDNIGGELLYRISFTPDGAPVLYWQQPIRSTWWRDLLPALMVAATVFAGPVGNSIAGAVLPAEFVAAYPAASQAFGRFAVRLALTGGDVAMAARGALAGLAGAQAGELASAIDENLGPLTEAATSAIIAGSDPRQAVAFKLLTLTGQKMDDYLGADAPVEPSTLEDLGINIDAVNFPVGIEDAIGSAGFSIDSIIPDESGNFFDTLGYVVSMNPDAFIDAYWVDTAGNVRSPDNAIVANVETDSSAEVQTAIANDLQTRGGTVVRSITAGEGDGRPADTPPPSGEFKIPGVGDILSVIDRIGSTVGKLFQTWATVKTQGRYPYPVGGGTPRPQIPGVAVPQPDGSTITNNGNGTSTIRRPDGSVQVISSGYGTATRGIAGISNSTLLIGGAVLVAALLMRRR